MGVRAGRPAKLKVGVRASRESRHHPAIAPIPGPSPIKGEGGTGTPVTNSCAPRADLRPLRRPSAPATLFPSNVGEPS